MQVGVSLVLSFMIVWDLPTIGRGVSSLATSRVAPIYNEVAPSLRVFGQLFGKALGAQVCDYTSVCLGWKMTKRLFPTSQTSHIQPLWVCLTYVMYVEYLAFEIIGSKVTLMLKSCCWLQQQMQPAYVLPPSPLYHYSS